MMLVCVYEGVCVSGPSHTERARSTNEEPSRRPCPNMGDGVLGAKDAHWLKMIRVEEMTSEPDPASFRDRYDAGLYLFPKFFI